MGTKPSPKHSIDRIDVNGDYEPSNCRWATSLVQMRNTRWNVQILYKGKNYKMWELELVSVVKKELLYNRIFKKGWDVERAISTPKDEKKVHKTKSVY